MEFNCLYTPWGENFSPKAVYPRPQLRRAHWLSLDGEWDFAVSESEDFPAAYDRAIRVPYAPESLLSGIGAHFGEDQKLYYRRSFRLPEAFPAGGRVLLHFGAVDQTALLRLNGRELGSHDGGYTAFTFEITEALCPGENTLELRVTDDLRLKHQPYGKQRLDRGGMWYTPVSGIWQTVWLEWVPEVYIPKLKLRSKGNRVFVDTGDASLDGSLLLEGRSLPLRGGKAEFTVENPRFWSPEDPHLYGFSLQVGEDRVESYFALRDLEVKTVDGLPRLCLNGKPYFFHGLLDQGYWSDGLYTPADPACFEDDILKMKALGFNTLRKHIKIEPEQFYYDCDRLGMIVFQDMVNNGKYHFIKDTALPTVGLQKCSDRRRHRDPLLRQTFYKTMETTVEQLDSHPCICYWTIFNEGWGQFCAQEAYERLKKLDDSRFIDSTSGWFRCADSDVESLHIYFKPLKFKATGKPLVLSEFGGFAYAPKEHSFNPHKVYGYAKYDTEADYAAAVAELYGKLQPWVKAGLCAAIYTQVSDVEDETNGILTYDRRICKLKPQQMRPIAEALKL